MGRNPSRRSVVRGGSGPVDVGDADEIERASRLSHAAEWRSDRDGERVAATSRSDYRLAARHQLPAVYSLRYSWRRRLISYGPDNIELTGMPPATSIASSKARSRVICRYRRREISSS